MFIADSAQPHGTRTAVAPDPTFAAHVLQRVTHEQKHHDPTEVQVVVTSSFTNMSHDIRLSELVSVSLQPVRIYKMTVNIKGGLALCTHAATCSS